MATGPTQSAITYPPVYISRTADLAARTAAEEAAAWIRECIQTRGSARIMVGTGNSQLGMVRHLVRLPGVDWRAVEAFHLDEYVGIPNTHPASFQRWIRTEFADRVHPKAVHYLTGDVGDVEAMVRDYGQRLLSAPVDLAFVGIGENGHIAFNDPHVADFSDPVPVKRVQLDEACRNQQVGEGHFPNLAAVPVEAVTVTCSGLFRARRWICCVPDQRKARAVHDALLQPVTEACPGSLVRRHPAASLHLDQGSGALLPADFVRDHCQVQS